MIKVHNNKKAICPRCNKQWLWDWDNDVFRFTDGKEIFSEEIIIGKNELFACVCDCGKINAIILQDDDGMEIMDNGDFTQVDWEAEENSYKIKLAF